MIGDMIAKFADRVAAANGRSPPAGDCRHGNAFGSDELHDDRPPLVPEDGGLRSRSVSWHHRYNRVTVVILAAVPGGTVRGLDRASLVPGWERLQTPAVSRQNLCEYWCSNNAVVKSCAWSADTRTDRGRVTWSMGWQWWMQYRS